MTMAYLLKGGRLVDPARRRDETADLFLENGRIAPPPLVLPPDTVVLDVSGRVVVPALTDLHAHLREPGGEAAETIETGSQAAAAGGFGRVVAMPNTAPPLDTPDALARVRERAEVVGAVAVWPSACLTRGRAGKELAPLEELAAAGAVAFTDDGSTVMSDELMRAALARAAKLGRVVMDHAQDANAERAGVMHAGPWAERWGLPGIPAEAEARVVARDIQLARETGGALHLQHLSAAASLPALRLARRQGLRVSAELTPHHLALADEDIDPLDANYKMNPPLRSASDRQALLDALLDGTITCLATDHAPHTAEAKSRGFPGALFGIVGLETAVGVTYTRLVASGLMSLTDWMGCWLIGPAAALGRPPPTLDCGAPADVTVLNLDDEWTVMPERFRSRSRNTPFAGWRLTGRAVYTFHDGRLVGQADGT